jgi:outer membrane protein assembly factor BamD (BamD/ComL family)
MRPSTIPASPTGSSNKLSVFQYPSWPLLTKGLQLLNSNRYGDARAAFKEVQDRHVEIVKIEQTITELAQMFNDVSDLGLDGRAT